MMLTKRLQNKGRKLLAVTLSVFLVLSLVSFLSPIHAHAEGDNIPEKAPEQQEQQEYLVTITLTTGETETDIAFYKDLTLRTGQENEIYSLKLKKARIPAGEYALYNGNEMILIRSISIGTDDVSELHTDFGSELSITLRWEKAPETCTEHLYSEEWMCEENGKTHFHECILCGEKLDIAEHIASDWIVDKAATLTKTGSQHKECTVCKIILLTEEIPVPEPEVPEHIHQYEENWTFNETHHWKKCIATEGTCPEPEGEKAAHLFDEGKIIKDATEETEGTKTYTCETCGYTYNETIPKLEHTHKFSTEWQSDATSHWHLCKCGAKSEVKPHTAGDWIIDKKPTAATVGSQHKECTVCKKVLETKELPKLTAPKITAGAGQIYRQKSNQNLTITCSDNVENLTGVYVADGLVHKSNYVTDPKNQTVTLKAAYLDSLAEGTHSLKLAFSNGTCTETQFTIQKTAAVKTGDQSNYIPLIILLILSGGVLIVTSVIRKKGFNG